MFIVHGNNEEHLQEAGLSKPDCQHWEELFRTCLSLDTLVSIQSVAVDLKYNNRCFLNENN